MLYLHTLKFKDLPLFSVVDMYVCILYVAESPKILRITPKGNMYI